MIIRISKNPYDLALWVNLIALQFGFSVLASPATAELRGFICLISVAASLILALRSLIRRRTQIVAAIILLFSATGLLYGAMNGADSTGLVLDLTVSLSAICAIELCYAPEQSIERYLKYTAWTAIVMTVVAWLADPISLDAILSRAETWSGLYYCGCMFWAAPFMLLYAFNTKRNMKLAVAYFLFAALINILYLKRQFIVEAVATLLAMALYSAIRDKKLKRVFQVLIGSVAAVVGLYLFFKYVLGLDMMPIVERISERFGESEETGFVRYEESFNYLSRAEPLEILLGKGFGVSHGGLGKANTALHIGLSNLILKFGAVFALLFVIVVFALVGKCITKRNQGALVQTCNIMTLINVAEFCLLSNFWLTTPCYAWFIFCLLACNFRKPEEQVGKGVDQWTSM